MKKQNGLAELTVRSLGALKRFMGVRGKTIFIACFPKSGSTFLMELLCEVTGFLRPHLVYSYERSDQNIYLPALVDVCNKKSIIQQHARATHAHINFIDQYKLTPVILTRNIFDVIVSLVDYFDTSMDPKMFVCYTAPEYASMTRRDKIAMMVELAAPWYFNFYAGWWDAIQNGDVKATWVTYENLTADPEKTVAGILDFAAIKPIKSASDAIESVTSKRIRFNKGVSGRGQVELDEEQRQSITSLARFYPWIDFSYMGL